MWNGQEEEIEFCVVKVNVNLILELQTCVKLNLIQKVEAIVLDNIKMNVTTFIWENRELFEGMGKLPFSYSIN